MINSTLSPLGRIKDAARVGDVFAATFVPKLRQLSDQTRSEEQMVPFLRAAHGALVEASTSLSNEQQRQMLRTLGQRQILHELDLLAGRAASHNRQNRARTAQAMGSMLLAEAARWPEDDRHFDHCIHQGLAMLEDPGHRTQWRERLLTARLEALAPVNIAYAMRVFERHQDWLTPQQQNQMRGFLTRLERVVRAGLLADAIAKLGPVDGWLDKVASVAACEQDGDAPFHALLREAVSARRDEAQRIAAKTAQTRNNALLRAVLDQHITRLETLLNTHPHLAVAWDQADAASQRGLLELMRLQRLRRQDLWNDQARKLFHLAMGEALLGRGRFYAEKLSAPHWNIVPAALRLVLIKLQDQRDDPATQSGLRRNFARLRRLCADRAPDFAACGLSHLA